MTDKTTMQRVRDAMERAIGSEIAPGSATEDITNDQALFYDAAKESHDAAVARGSAGLDSLDRVEVMMELEEEFELEIPDAAFEGANSPNTIEAIAAYIDGRAA